ncbi:PREDICTED: complement factor H-related protein 3 [Myotis brandtii]|uniref:complement factor H-related protein 3 n=1 Tax=Myotis brandtii TaxID=109478 RepID=UPI0007044859|nr:PREDICTED: complement factor H-related protein 3 [Myotis brandtii]
MQFLVKVILTLWVSWARGQVKPCEFPEIKHGSLYYGNWYRSHFPVSAGQWFHYSCDDNYVTPSQTKWHRLTCTQDGWTPEVPCRKICLKSKANIENGFIAESESTYPLNKKTKYKCKQGYVTEDGHTSGSITCLQNGWSAQPRCIKMALISHAVMLWESLGNCFLTICLPFPYALFLLEICLKSKANIENGFIAESESTYPLNKKTKYKCKQGYVTEDGHTSGSITCLQNGWSAQPRCIKLCDLPIFENATVIFTGKALLPNDTLDYQCLDGYENRDGNALGSMLCSEDGWLHLPTCFSKYFESIISFSKIQFVLQHLKCSPKYVTCSYGKWSEVPRCMDPCVISEEIMNEKNIQLKGKDDKPYYVKTGDIVEFMCKSGHKAVTSEESFQAVCREGTVKLPRCE